MDKKLKRCSKCKELKSIDEFYTNQVWCKECFRIYNARYHIEHRDEILKRHEERRNSPHGKEVLKKWRNSPHGKEVSKRWDKIYQEKETTKRYQKVKSEVHKAVARGDIVKPKLCELCRKERRLDSHHEDYSKPLQVVWLCSGCHGKRHSAGNDDIKKKIRMIYEKKYNVANKKVMVVPERRYYERFSKISIP